MKGDVPIPAFRLLTSLPVRTHIKPDPERKLYRRKPIPTQIREGPRPIKIGRRTFETQKEAVRVMRISRITLLAWIKSGKAKYL